MRETRFTPRAARPGIADSFRFWRAASGSYRRIVLWLTLFALANASDAFLILRARELGLGDAGAIGCYIGYNLIFALAAFPAGRLSDKLGRKRMMVAGLLLYMVAYACFALTAGTWGIVAGFLLYGIYAALTEGVSKAWISDLVPNERRGLAIGLQTTLASLAALVASSWCGFVWNAAGAAIPLLTASAAALAAAIGLAVWREPAVGRANGSGA